MSDIVEGRRAVLEALKSGSPVIEVMLAQGAKDAPAIADIVRAASDASVPIKRVGRAELDAVSARGAHQGVVARVLPFEYADLVDVVAAHSDDARSLIVALDHIQDPGNLGATIRSAEALGAHAVLIPKARAASVTPVVIKASAGATAHLPVAREPNLVRALGKLKDAGYWVFGADSEAQPVGSADLADRMVLVLGSEGAGLSRLTKESCDELVGIPLAGNTASLNVAQAATLLVYEWAQRR